MTQVVFNVSTAESSDSSAVFKPYKPAQSDSTSTTTSTTSTSTFQVKPDQQIDLDSLDMDDLVTDYHPDV